MVSGVWARVNGGASPSPPSSLLTLRHLPERLHGLCVVGHPVRLRVSVVHSWVRLVWARGLQCSQWAARAAAVGAEPVEPTTCTHERRGADMHTGSHMSLVMHWFPFLSSFICECAFRWRCRALPRPLLARAQHTTLTVASGRQEEGTREERVQKRGEGEERVAVRCASRPTRPVTNSHFSAVLVRCRPSVRLPPSQSPPCSVPPAASLPGAPHRRHDTRVRLRRRVVLPRRRRRRWSLLSRRRVWCAPLLRR